MRWEILGKDNKNIVETLLANRGIKSEKEKREFLDPTNPEKISIESLGIKKSSIKTAIERIKKAKKNTEKIIIYGDYDADGICATAIMWEALHDFGLDVLPHVPDRFEEGYGINPASVENLKTKIPELKLIVTVDNGIVAHEGIKKAKALGIDVIVVDHHQKGTKKLATSYILHTTLVCGSALAWFFAKELGVSGGLELAAIGTIADQMPLIGVNRSIVKFGLVALNKTKRPGFLALTKDAKIENIGTYEVNYIIAPRINAMGRLAHGIDSLRLLCTKSPEKAKELSSILTRTNLERQKIVDEAVVTALSEIRIESEGPINKVIVIASESYHEGVIGLAAGKLAEEFYRPAIVLSKKGDISKASARSIPGFNIIEAIRQVNLHSEGGGHPMAAGFSIETSKIEDFTKKINKLAEKLLTEDILQRKMKIDLEVGFEQLDYKLLEKLSAFDPTGLGNPAPAFVSLGVAVVDTKTVGRDARHLKLKLKQNDHFFDAIYFGGGEMYSKLTPDIKVDVAYNLEDNTWNGYKSLQLKIKDIRV